ncbi:hypothetical protein J2T60_001311 [Natronospira proteinivora]|uniref:Uncharacterized protein n=1 Tax=Natronospira proteinivora TaxID=1807133 RepID=A0ABT1G7Q7_9GAMM|nr:hypothetical protein [Natronospira proteinivora]
MVLVEETLYQLAVDLFTDPAVATIDQIFDFYIPGRLTWRRLPKASSLESVLGRLRTTPRIEENAPIALIMCGASHTKIDFNGTIITTILLIF